MFVWKVETNSASPLIPAAKKGTRRKASTSLKEVSNPVSAGLLGVCCTPEFCCHPYLERDKLSLTWEALNEKRIFLLGHNLTGDQNLKGPSWKACHSAGSQPPEHRWWRSEECSPMACTGPGFSSIPSQPAIMGELSTDSNVSFRKKEKKNHISKVSLFSFSLYVVVLWKS